MLEAGPFSDGKVVEAAKKFETVIAIENMELMAKFKVQSIPKCFFVNPETEKVVGRLKGSGDPDDVVRQMDEAVEKLKKQMEKGAAGKAEK